MTVPGTYRSRDADRCVQESLGSDQVPLDADGRPARYVLPVVECRLRLTREVLPHETPQLRGFFGRRFADEVRLHHHRPDGSLLYEYPVVQFKVVDNVAVLLGLAEGASLVSRLWMQVDRARLGTEDLSVLEAGMVWRPAPLGETQRLVAYRFVTPWLALNQQNARRYRQADSDRQRRHLLERVLIGNCLSLAKAFGHTVTGRLSADCTHLRSLKTALKGTPMIGFKGTVKVNFDIPDLVGLGKSVSRGFGAVRRVGPDDTGEGGR